MPGGPTANDNAVAGRLNTQLTGKLRGAMDGYRVSCARVIISTIAARGLPQHAGVIAITTAIVESVLENINVEIDHDSLGLFQQRASWGSREERLNPPVSTNKFIDKMLSLFPSNSWLSQPIGVVCQRVQVSQLPSAYQPQAADAAIITGALWPQRPRDRSVSDVTGDGFADVLAYRASGELLQYSNNILINPGGVPYTGGRPIGEGWGGFKHVLAADVTGDGFAEAIAVNAEGKMFQYDNNILVNPGGVPYTGGREIGHGWQGFKRLLAADVSGDGSADILGISGENDLWYYPNNRGSNPGGVPFMGGRKIGEGWDRFTKVLLGDVTGDRYADVLGVEPNGHMFMFPNNIGVSPDRPYGYSVDIGQGWGGFVSLLAADVSGDGSADVLGVDPDGQMRYYPNNSGSNPGGLPFTGGLVVGVGWQGLTIASSS
uniref:VCBS repeat-containing protein n=1 Tax=Nonomuraea gerenzanensis TaxID=93944 RepID=A0A1M4EDE8_9ACTN|nr:hypothetical protein BN4615_P6320 [Nonomuraea gerenzanensis]